MGYIDPQVSKDLIKLEANPNLLAGAGGGGLNFKARNVIRQTAMTIVPATHNIEIYHPTVLANTVCPQAIKNATTSTGN